MFHSAGIHLLTDLLASRNTRDVDTRLASRASRLSTQSLCMGRWIEFEHDWEVATREYFDMDYNKSPVSKLGRFQAKR